MSLFDTRLTVTGNAMRPPISGLLLIVTVFFAASAAAEKIPFRCDLNADDVAVGSDSTASGHVSLFLDRDTQTISWKLNYTGLSAEPTDISIRGPAGRGGVARVLKDLGGAGLKSPLTGSWMLEDGELEILLQRQMYIQIATVNYMEGEIRCQIEKDLKGTVSGR